MKHLTLILITFLTLSVVCFSCNTASQQGEGTATTDTTDVAAQTTEKIEEKMPEDKSKRPSPPAKVEAKVADVTVTIDYSQPAAKGRTIFGDIVPFGEVWRTGANEATIITFDKDVLVEGTKLAAGSYALFSIPNEKEWVLIFNTKANQWGAFEYKQAEDALRVNVKPIQEKEITERFTITATESGIINLQWDKTKISFKIQKA
jgi:predicted small secreted protein